MVVSNQFFELDQGVELYDSWRLRFRIHTASCRSDRREVPRMPRSQAQSGAAAGATTGFRTSSALVFESTRLGNVGPLTGIRRRSGSERCCRPVA